MKYQVIYPLRHNGKRYAPADLVEMSEEAAAPLLTNGALVASVISETHQEVITGDGSGETLPPADEKPKTGGATNDDLVDAMVEYLHAVEAPLDKKPHVADLEAALENKAINAPMRDEAFAIYVEQVNQANAEDSE